MLEYVEESMGACDCDCVSAGVFWVPDSDGDGANVWLHG